MSGADIKGTEIKEKTEFKENCDSRFVEAIAGGLGMLIMPCAAVLLILYADAVAVVNIIIAFIFFVILEIACIILFVAGLNEFYNHGKTGLVIGVYGVQIAFRAGLFKRELVQVPYSDVQKFCVYRDRWEYYLGDPYIDFSLKPYKVKKLKKGWVTFFDLCGNKYSVHIFDCMEAGARITQHLDESQINRGESDVRKGRKRKK